MISFYSKVCLWLLLLASFPSFAQTPVFCESEMAVNTKLNPRFSFNANISNRSLTTKDVGNQPFNLQARHLQIAINSAYEVGFYSKLGGGIMYRWNTLQDSNAENEIRTTQQFSIVRYYNTLRLVHRFKADQRFKGPELEHRLRYRLSTDFPLQGLSLDTKEFYLLLSTESVFNYGKEINPIWDQRVNTGIGYQLSNPLKLQLSLQYRWEDYTGTTNHRMFFNTQVFYKI